MQASRMRALGHSQSRLFHASISHAFAQLDGEGGFEQLHVELDVYLPMHDDLSHHPTCMRCRRRRSQ